MVTKEQSLAEQTSSMLALLAWMASPGMDAQGSLAHGAEQAGIAGPAAALCVLEKEGKTI